MKEEFNSLLDLYKKIKPALSTKKNELKRFNINYIKEEDIWNFLKEEKWVKYQNLTLSQMVSDVLNCDDKLLVKYMHKQINKLQRNINTDE